ncbi:MAG: tRNA (adenosine(37)-N6)-threonylcarbamoyltransferase complex ATPase subunit type 1 TsaE [Planctomycetaceae bacterium]
MSESILFDSHCESDTDKLAQQMAGVLTSQHMIALNGQLGSGKTRFVRALCAALEIDTDQVNSPTFVLLQLYSGGRIPVAHFDTYRLADVDEFLAIGGDDFLNNGESLCLVEWADRIAEVLPADRLDVTIEQTGEHSRRFHMTATGPQSSVVTRHLQAAIPML